MKNILRMETRVISLHDLQQHLNDFDLHLKNATKKPLFTTIQLGITVQQYVDGLIAIRLVREMGQIYMYMSGAIQSTCMTQLGPSHWPTGVMVRLSKA